VTVKISEFSGFISNDKYLIEIFGMDIKNDRHQKDYAYLRSPYWSGMLQSICQNNLILLM